MRRALYAGNSSVDEIIMEIMLIVNNMLTVAIVLMWLVSSKTICMQVMSFEENDHMY